MVPAGVNFFCDAAVSPARYSADMRPILVLALLTGLASSAAGAQSVIPARGPNAQVAQRPLGPNAQVAQRPVGPNMALARTAPRPRAQVHYPSCSAAGALRATPLRRGEPGYGRHLDRDGDGVACE